MHGKALKLHAFCLLSGHGPARLERILRYFGDIDTGFVAKKPELLKCGLDEKIADEFIKLRQTLDLKTQQKKLEENQIWLLTKEDKNYPRLLKEISKPPELLYVRGKMEDAEELLVAVVGTRKISNYGRTVMPYLISPIISAGAIIVSGMALGVDAAAHSMAIEKNQRTVAILGCGLDDASLYPKEHGLLAQKILETGGALLSEYPPKTPALRHHFIFRNRIIAGMSAATVVVECDLKSGSLITAQYALEENRTVFAVPGPIYAEGSKGPNNLIKMGAKPLCQPEDLFAELNLNTLSQTQNAKKILGDSKEENAVLKILNLESKHVNVIIKEADLPASAVSTALTFLEMKGRIKNIGGQQYILLR